jgi:hypothetical protein
MHLLDYDEFNIYTTIEDVEEYVEKLIFEGFESFEDIHRMCIDKFGYNLKSIIDELFHED